MESKSSDKSQKKKEAMTYDVEPKKKLEKKEKDQDLGRDS